MEVLYNTAGIYFVCVCMCNDENFRLVVASFTIIGTHTRDVPNKRTKRDRSESKPLEPTSLYYFYYFFFSYTHRAQFSLDNYKTVAN